MRLVGWHHRLNGREFEQAPGAGDGQGGLTFTESQSRTRLMTEQQEQETASPQKKAVNPTEAMKGAAAST